MTQAVERAIETLNRQFAPHLSVDLVEAHGDRFLIEFRGPESMLPEARSSLLQILKRRSLTLIEQDRTPVEGGYRLTFQAVP